MDDFEALRVYPDGSHKMYTHKLVPFDVPLPLFFGSGMPYAYGAYAATKDIYKAVEAACECSLSCATPIIKVL